MKRKDPQELIAAVPPEHRWLRALVASLGRTGIVVSEAVLADGHLRIATSTGSEGILALRVQPRGEPAATFLRTRHFAIAYDGAGDLGPEHRMAASRFARVLQKLESSMPRSLGGYASLARPRPDPAETLRVLFPFLTVERSEVPEHLPWAAHGDVTEVLVRTTARCNQACPFCSAPQHEEPAFEVLRSCFQTVADLLPGAMVSLTGGEPSLRSDFLRALSDLMNQEGIGRIQVQTNALRFASAIDPREIARDERLSFFVSLHALEEGIYDACTGTSGGLPRAIQGVAALLAAGHQVTINALINKENIGSMAGFVRRLGQVFPGAVQPGLHFSVLICPEWNPRASDHLVTYRELAGAIDEAMAVGRELGLDLSALLSSTHATMPPCTLPAAARDAGRHRYKSATEETGYEDFSKPYIKGRQCRSCAVTDQCLGVPKPYAERFGLTELTPIAPRDL